MTRPPLQSHRILVTAEESAGRRLTKALAREGATCLSLPCLRVLPPENPKALEEASRRLDAFDWIVITSANGIRSLKQCLDGALPDGPLIAAVGPTTSKICFDLLGREADLVPLAQATADALHKALVERGVHQKKILILQGQLADESLSESLRAAGAEVTRVEAYRTIEGVEDVEEARRLLSCAPGVSAVTLMSGSAARALQSAVGSKLFSAQRLICIGPSTEQVIHQLGANPAAVASPHTVAGLVGAVLRLLGHSRDS